MILKKTLYAAVAMLCFAFLSYTIAAENPGASKPDKNKLEKTTGTPRWGQLNINNITTWMRYDGEGNHSPGGDNGVFYPIGTGNVVYEDGLVFGGKVFTDAGYTTPPSGQGVRIGGSTYLSNVGTKAGYVTGTGATASAADPNLADVRVFRIRRDYYTMTDGEAARDAQLYYELDDVKLVTPTQIAAIRQQYDTDWQNWPVAKGAPYVDRNGNGVYDKPPAFSATFTQDELISGNYDEPGVAGSDPSTPADQVMFTVYNDLDRSTAVKFEGADPLGLEIQKLAWAYKRQDALGNVYFTRYRIINKGGVVTSGTTLGSFYIDSMYVCQWSDIDLGDAGDDLVGCDTVKSLGYVYNGKAVDNTFVKFGLPPPASGYDFLAGPMVAGVASDSAVFNLKIVKGKKNLPMTSFAYFSAGTTYTDPPFGDYARGAGQWWKMLRGYAPTGTISTSDQAYPYPTGQTPGMFPFAGDPTQPGSLTNFIDGQGTSWSAAPGDRRILLNTGPFRLAPSDTQEIYVGFVVGIGADRISSVSVMKANDLAVQTTFNYRFQVAKPPAAPIVSFSEINEQVIFEWGSNATRVAQTENLVIQPGTYKFEGYNVYQLPSAGSAISEGKRIAVFDLIDNVKIITDQLFDLSSGRLKEVDVQTGNDNGIQRYFTFKRDYLKDVDKLYNGKEYYIAVTAYSYSTAPGFPTSLESTPVIFTVRPKVPFGVVLSASPGDTVHGAARVAGVGDGKIVPLVVNPAVLTNHTYRVSFDTATVAGVLNKSWRVTDKTTNTVKASGITNESGDNAYPIVDGVMVKVFGAPNDTKDFLHVRNPSGVLNPFTYAAFAFNGSGFPTQLVGPTGPNNTGALVDRPEADWGGGQWGIHTGGNNADFTYLTRFVARTFRNDNFTRFVPNDYEIRFTAAGGKANMWYASGNMVNVPFELWCIGSGTPNDPSDDYRMIPWINDVNANDVFDLDSTDHTISGGDNDPETDWIYWMEPNPKTPGSAGYNTFAATTSAAYDGTQGTGKEVMARMVLVNWNGGSITAANWPNNVNSRMPAAGNTIRILSTKPNNPSIAYEYTTVPPTTGDDLNKLSAGKVTVFPNPYYGFNKAELTRFDRFVTFNNLPQNVTIRIFNVAGHLVRTLRKNNADQFLRWSITNEYNYPVASGMYIAYVDMPDVPATKVIKFAIIQEQELMDIF